MAAAVVDDRLPDCLGHFLDVAQQFVDRHLREVRVPASGLVQVVHVGLVVLVVVNLHRQRVDVRFERIEGVGQRRQREARLVFGERRKLRQQQGRGPGSGG